MPHVVVGVDGYSRGWVAIVLREGSFHDAQLFPAFREVLTGFPDAEVIAVDIPIGLPEREPRQADLAAKAFLGPRHNAVFLIPPWEVLEAVTYDEANKRSIRLTGQGVSKQAYALRGKIFEVDSVVCPAQMSRVCLPRIVEVHPEVSFRALAGKNLRFGKRTWGGLVERRRLLEGAGLVIPDDLGDASKAGPDDVLDAAVAAWSALRVARLEATTLPEDSESDARGRPMAIWF